MPITIKPFNEARDIYLYEFDGNWTWDEIYKGLVDYKESIKGTTQRIDNIIDFRQSNGIPNGAITHLKAIANSRPEQTYLAVFVTDNRFARMILEIAARLNTTINEKYKLASTMEEALAMIEESRANDVSV